MAPTTQAAQMICQKELGNTKKVQARLHIHFHADLLNLFGAKKWQLTMKHSHMNAKSKAGLVPRKKR